LLIKVKSVLFHRLPNQRFCSFVLFFSLCSPIYGWATPSIEQLIWQADEKFRQSQLSACLQTLQQAEKLLLTNDLMTKYQADILWRMSRTYTEQGNKIYQVKGKEHKNKAKQLFIKAEQFARRAVKLSPKDSQSHLCVSIAAGSLTQVVGVKKKVKLSETVREFADRAVELDPTNHRAHYILARWHHGMANVSGILLAVTKLIYGGLPPASTQQAIYHFQQAIRHNPNSVEYRLEFSRIALSLKNWTIVQQQLNMINTLIAGSTVTPKLEAEIKQIQARVRQQVK